MARQTLIWTALPNGYTSDGNLRLSVLLSPRLYPETEELKSLSFFPDWQDWPSVLRGACFEVTFNNGEPLQINYDTSGSNRIDDTLGLPESNVWQAIFNEEIPVTPYAYDNKGLSGNVVLSYDTVFMENKIKDTYRKLASKANGSLPLVRNFLEDPDWNELIETIYSLDQIYADKETGLRNPAAQFSAYRPLPVPRILKGGDPVLVPFEEPKPELTNFRDFQLFHTPSGNPEPHTEIRNDDPQIKHQWLEYKRQDLPRKEDLAKKLDFHQIVAAMGSYPTLLRKLGIVVDLLLDPDEFDLVQASDGELSVSVNFGDKLAIQTNNKFLVTHTLMSATQFQAISSSNAADTIQIKNGLLNLDPDKFGLLQMDVDSAGLKMMNFARSLGRRREPDMPASGSSSSSSSSSSSGSAIVVKSLSLSRQSRANNRVHPVTRHEDEIGAPSLRTGGLMLVHKDRKSVLESRFNRNMVCNSIIELEGQPSENNINLQLFAEDLVRGYRIDIWDSKTTNWHSLCRRTARYELGDGEGSGSVGPIVVNADPEEECTIRLAATKSASDNSAISDFLYLHEIMASWTGWSLAAPPPGRVLSPDYNPDTPDSADNPQFVSEAEIPPGIEFKSSFKPVPNSLPRLRFGRSYKIRARAVDLAGNSLAPLLIDFGPEDPVSLEVPYLRYEPVAAPIIALLSKNGIIEQPAEGESMACIAIRSFNDTAAENIIPSRQFAYRAVVPPKVSVREAEQHGKLDSPDGKMNSEAFDLLANQKDIDPRDDSAAVREVKISSQGPLDSSPVQTTYAVYEDGRQLTYLPDPLALEVAVRIFDHPNIADTEIMSVSLYPRSGDWPEAQPFLIEVFDDPNEKPHFDDTRRVLCVPLPKAVRAKIRLSMKIASEDLDKLAIFALLEGDDLKNKPWIRALSLDGQHWMLTPWTVVEVVHAVQRPLIAPQMRKLSIAERPIGATSVRPIIESSCSVSSTDRLDLQAEWHEPIDDAELQESAAGPVDRMRRDIAFSVKITDAKNYDTHLNGFVAGGFPDHTIKDQDANVIGVNDIDDDLLTVKTHEFHDTRYRRIEYWFDATTQFREYLPNNLLTTLEGDDRVPVDTHIKVTGPHTVTWVPNSAPPPAPKVLYIVPTFGWIRAIDQEFRQSSWRRGGGLRVYLDRPWNASGYGEMLAVALPPAGFTGNPDRDPVGHPYNKYVTQWGNDPIWDSPFVSGIAPTRGNFSLARYAPDASGDWLPPGAPEAEKDQQPGDFKVTDLQPPPYDNSNDANIEVAPHDVFYDAERQLWYCDIEIEAGASYFPFVRLALARYQPISSNGAHLSNIVLADFMALTVDRWLVVMPTSTDTASYQVAIFGVGLAESSAYHEAGQASSVSVLNPSTGQTKELTPATVAKGSVIEVWVEKLDSRLGEDFGWQRTTDAAVTPQQPENDGFASPSEPVAQTIFIGSRPVADRQKAQELLAARDVESLTRDRLIDVVRSWQRLWGGNVVLPAPPNECNRYRLVIAEYEEYLVDDDRPYDRVPTRKDRRLVFVEHIELM